MTLSKEDIQIIETIVRQQWCNPVKNPEHAKFEEWLGVDQDQALALIEMIPNRLPANPSALLIFPKSDRGGKDAD